MKIHHTLIIIALALTSCSLNETPRSELPEDVAYTSKETLYINTVATLYNYIGGYEEGQGLQGAIRGVYDLQTFGSDEAMIPLRGVDWYDGGLWQDMYKHSWIAGHDLVKNSWLYLYKVITLCNRSLETLETYKDLAGQENYQNWTAEVRTFRAMYYWYLIDLFGDVPLVTNSSVSMNEVKREKRAEVFKFCENELLSVVYFLSAENSTREGDYYGRITQPVVYFILAKLMLESEVYTGVPRWDDCILYCDELEFLNYRLEQIYQSNFIVYNQYSSENIFTIPMDKNLFSNQQQNIMRSLHYRHVAAYGYGGENGACATLKTLQVFNYPDGPDPPFLRLLPLLLPLWSRREDHHRPNGKSSEVRARKGAARPQRYALPGDGRSANVQICVRQKRHQGRQAHRQRHRAFPFCRCTADACRGKGALGIGRQRRLQCRQVACGCAGSRMYARQHPRRAPAGTLLGRLAPPGPHPFWTVQVAV